MSCGNRSIKPFKALHHQRDGRARPPFHFKLTPGYINFSTERQDGHHIANHFQNIRVSIFFFFFFLSILSLPTSLTVNICSSYRRILQQLTTHFSKILLSLSCFHFPLLLYCLTSFSYRNCNHWATVPSIS